PCGGKTRCFAHPPLHRRVAAAESAARPSRTRARHTRTRYSENALRRPLSCPRCITGNPAHLSSRPALAETTVAPERASAERRTPYFSLAPAVSPVFGLTKCSRPQAWQTTPSYASSLSSDSLSSTQPCTRKPVFGQRYRKEPMAGLRRPEQHRGPFPF